MSRQLGSFSRTKRRNLAGKFLPIKKAGSLTTNSFHQVWRTIDFLTKVPGQAGCLRLSNPVTFRAWLLRSVIWFTAIHQQLIACVARAVFALSAKPETHSNFKVGVSSPSRMMVSGTVNLGQPLTQLRVGGFLSKGFYKSVNC